MFTVRVPYPDGSQRRTLSDRPDEGAAEVRLAVDGAYVTTGRWGDPPEEYTVVDGEAFACGECGALFDNESSRDSHLASHAE